MKSPDTTYTNSYEHLSQDQLMRYQQERMDDAEMHRVERHLLECELCSDALEGMELLSAKQAEHALHDLKGRLAARLGEQKSTSRPLYWQIGVAASVLLLAGAVFYWLNLTPINEQEAISDEMDLQETADSAQSAPYLSYQEEKENKKAVEEEIVSQPVQTEKEQKSSPSKPQIRAEKTAPPQSIEVEQEMELELELEMEPEPDQFAVIAELAPKETEVEEVEIELEEFAEVEEVSPPAVADVEMEEEFDSVIESIHFKPENSLAQTGREGGGTFAGYKVLKGKVTDSSGEPIPGVSVRLAGSNKTVVTDLEGTYRLQLPRADTSLQMSFIGFETKELRVPGDSTQLLAVLDEDVKSLSEVVVMGYARQKRRDVSGAVSTVAEVVPPKPTVSWRAFKKYLKQNRRYTAEAREAEEEGVVVVEFFVEPDSTLSNFQVLKSPGYGLEQEAIRLLKEGPAWQPATSGEKPIRHKAKVRIPFKLD